MDRRELADIGLNLSDVRDASALPLDRDPTELLAERARERRRTPAQRGFPEATTADAPAPKPGWPDPRSTALRETTAA